MAKSKMKKNWGPWHAEIDVEQKAMFYKNKFYAKADEFQTFETVSPKVTRRFDGLIKANFPENSYPYNSSKRYFAVLDYVFNYQNKSKFPSYDEKIIFFIQALDPDLSIYFYYLRMGYSHFASKEERNQKEHELMAFTQSAIGVMDARLLKYEELYLVKFLKDESIVSHVNSDYSSSFFAFFDFLTSFDEVSEAEFRYVSNRVAHFQKKCEDPSNPNTVFYNLLYAKGLLEIWFYSHQIIFFIQAVDPELKALRIYYEEAQSKYIEARIIQEFGFYHESLIKIEKAYRKRFCPGMDFGELGL